MALGMPELVMKDMQAYEEMAVRLGKDSGLVKQIKDKLSLQKKTAPLFDMDRLTRHIEQAYVLMQERALKGQSVQNLEFYE